MLYYIDSSGYMHSFRWHWNSILLTGILSYNGNTIKGNGVEGIYEKSLKYIQKESTATIKLHKVSEKIPKKKSIRQFDYFS